MKLLLILLFVVAGLFLFGVVLGIIGLLLGTAFQIGTVWLTAKTWKHANKATPHIPPPLS